MITIKTQREIEILREGGRKLAEVLDIVESYVCEGITTKELDKIAEEEILKRGATPSFKNYKPKGASSPYPATLCTSVNDEIVHAIPSDRKLKKGDLFSFDLGLWYKDLCVDSARSVLVSGVGSNVAKRLITVTKQALYEGIFAARAGARLGDIGYAIESYVRKNSNFGIVRDLAGHGVGYEVHEDPYVLNYGKKGTGEILKPGMVLALEPMITEGTWKVKVGSDGWAIKTLDGKLSAHFEHTIVITNSDPEILTESR